MKNRLEIKVLTILLLLLFQKVELTAQDASNVSRLNYNDAIGLRFGGTTGISVKHKFNQNNAIEIIAGTYPHAIGITGLYERFIYTSTPGLCFYAGAGAHLARGYFSSWGYSYNADRDQYYYYSSTYQYGPIVGLDAIGGAEYRFRDTPVALSLDLKPYVEFYGSSKLSSRLDPGLGVKFTF